MVACQLLWKFSGHTLFHDIHNVTLESNVLDNKPLFSYEVYNLYGSTIKKSWVMLYIKTVYGPACIKDNIASCTCTKSA